MFETRQHSRGEFHELCVSSGSWIHEAHEVQSPPLVGKQFDEGVEGLRRYANCIVVGNQVAGSRIEEDQVADAVGSHRGEQDSITSGVKCCHDRGLSRFHSIENGDHVLNRLFPGRDTVERNTVGGSSASPIEENQSREGGEAGENLPPYRDLPDDLNMNAQPVGKQEVDRSVTKHLICDIAFADTHVVGLWCIHREVHSISQMCVARPGRNASCCLTPIASVVPTGSSRTGACSGTSGCTPSRRRGHPPSRWNLVDST